jgi:hypothetical protein
MLQKAQRNISSLRSNFVHYFNHSNQFISRCPQAIKMSILIKTVRLAKPSSTNIARRNLTSRALMSTISDAIKKDHQEINEYAKNIRAAADEDAKVRWQNQFTWELARHSIGEELVVYPAFAKHLGAKGQEIADKDRAEHQPVFITRDSRFVTMQKIKLIIAG